MEGHELINQAQKIAEALIYKLKTSSLTLSLAESCTAGQVSALLANIPGASDVFWGSYVCYTPQAKVSMLGLDRKKLEADGLVSAETAKAMAVAAMQKSGTGLAAAVTGLSGPAGDGSNVPVGTVFIATVMQGGDVMVRKFNFKGIRKIVSVRAAIAVLESISVLLT